MNHYPPGAALDPAAPWNQIDPDVVPCLNCGLDAGECECDEYVPVDLRDPRDEGPDEYDRMRERDERF